MVSIVCWHSSSGLTNNTTPHHVTRLSCAYQCSLWAHRYALYGHTHTMVGVYACVSQVCTCAMNKNDVTGLVITICHKEAATRQLLAPMNTLLETMMINCTKFNGTWTWCVYLCVFQCMCRYVCV